jgi:hypothetical protein
VRNILTSIALCISSIPFAASAETPEQKGLAIAVDADKVNSGFKSEKADMTLDLINAHGETTARKMNIEVLEGVEQGDKSRSEFTWPADVKGTKLLTFTKKQGDDDQWLYLPAVKRTKRISSSNKSGSFMGSEFAYEDIGSQEPEKYTWKFLADAKEGGRDCWQLERIPVDKNSGYSRQVLWMDREYKQPQKIEYYDRKGELLKTSMFSDYKKFGALWRVGAINVVNAQTKKKSVLTWTNRKLGAQVDESNFRSEALGN